ncbi:MAG TPA: hypothetical protein PLL77_04525 [Pyrinomonadaceae bacterium]|nr:hypothetical protein [Pyrinomonadaceae bacterium]
MNDYIRRNLESGQRCRQWFIDYSSIIPSGSIFETKAAAMTAEVNNLENTAGQQEAAFGEGLSATDVKGSERQDLIDILDPCRNAARAAESDVPGTRDRYRYYRSMTHQALLAAGRSFAAGGATDESLLKSYGAPSGWPALVTAACDAYEAAFGQQDSAKGQSVAKNAEAYAGVIAMNAYKTQIRHFVKIYAANNPGAQAAWKTAAHVELPPKKKDPPTA